MSKTNKQSKAKRPYGKYMDNFKSTLEQSLKKECLEEYQYEPPESAMRYSVPHVYNPDFVHPNSPNIIIEVKGWFIKGSADAQKYISIARDNPEKELVFLFSNPDKKAYAGCRPRSDGTFMTLGEWCYKHRFLFFTKDNFPNELRYGQWTVEDIRNYKRQIYG